ncbi:hypothetical protein MKW92_044173 [Papaver armeniacum]|nr:hypothetical protein MKW92_044173 [Papaver armeniacum]
MDYLNLFLLILLPCTFLKMIINSAARNPHTNLLPGPVPVPIIGNLLKLGKKPQESLTLLAKRYGPLMSLKLGTLTTIVISSCAMAKEILQKNDQSFSSRYVLDAMTVFNHHKSSIVWHEKLNELGTYVRRNANSGSAVDIGQAAFTTVLNLISNIPNLSDFFPVLRFIDVQGIRRRTKKHVRILDEIFDKIINQKMILLQSREKNSGSSGDLLDIILDPSDENGIQLQRHEIKALLRVSTIFHMIKVHQEISSIIVRDQPIQEQDIVRLPYLQVIVKETLRLHPPVPLLVPHERWIDAKIHDAQVLVNVWAIGRDPTIWANPTCFKPERFLGSTLGYKGQDFELIPFGSGRRICPGLPLAHRMVHLMLGLLLQSFDWELENALKPEDLDMKEESGFTSVKATGLRAIPTAAL